MWIFPDRIAAVEGHVAVVRFFLEEFIKNHECQESLFLGALVMAAKNQQEKVGWLLKNVFFLGVYRIIWKEEATQKPHQYGRRLNFEN